MTLDIQSVCNVKIIVGGLKVFGISVEICKKKKESIIDITNSAI